MRNSTVIKQNEMVIATNSGINRLTINKTEDTSKRHAISLK